MYEKKDGVFVYYVFFFFEEGYTDFFFGCSSHFEMRFFSTIQGEYVDGVALWTAIILDCEIASRMNLKKGENTWKKHEFFIYKKRERSYNKTYFTGTNKSCSLVGASGETRVAFSHHEIPCVFEVKTSPSFPVIAFFFVVLKIR